MASPDCLTYEPSGGEKTDMEYRIQIATFCCIAFMQVECPAIRGITEWREGRRAGPSRRNTAGGLLSGGRNCLIAETLKAK